MSELTDRYVGATLRTIPDKQKADIEAELRASIDDAIEARVADGEGVGSAERQVLTDLGDPDRLAADYTDRPTYLIGPDHFFDYKRLVTTLLVTVVPIVMVVIGVIQVIGGGDAADVFGDVIGVGVSLVVHVVFWTTLVFYLIERSDEKPPASGWSLSDLPSASSAGQIELGDAIGSVVVLVFAIAALIFSRTVSPVTDSDGSAVPIFAPAMWDFWIPFLVGVLLAEVVFELVKYRVGRWTWPLASVNLALNVAFAAPAIYLLATDQLLNPAFFDELGWATPVAGTIGVTIAIAAIAAVALWDIVDGFRKARR